MKRFVCGVFLLCGFMACSASPLPETPSSGTGQEAVTCACKKKNPKAECGCSACKASDMQRCECGAKAGASAAGHQCPHH